MFYVLYLFVTHLLTLPRMYVCIYVFMYACMRASVAPGVLCGFYAYSVFRTFSIPGRCPMNMSILSPKIGALHMGLKIRK
jgi:hypothetical protein